MHDKSYRANRKKRIKAWIDRYNNMAVCDFCGKRDYKYELFTDEGTCTNCGICEYGNNSYGEEYVDNFRWMANIVLYNPRFYVKERINNWWGICPRIPNEYLHEIIKGCFASLSTENGASYHTKHFTRSLIYSVVNQLYGNKQSRSIEENKRCRRFLVFRERWIWIKQFIFTNFGSLLNIVGADEWLDRFYTYAPTRDLVFKLEKMIACLEKEFKTLLYAEKRNNNCLKRHNRPCRDVTILFLLYGIHPGLNALYGTDYWKPPITQKSKLENTQRFKILLKLAREQNPLNSWPSNETTLDEILAVDNVQMDFENMTDELYSVFPLFCNNIIRRKDCCLE